MKETIAKIYKTTSWFFEKMKKNVQTFSWIHQEKREVSNKIKKDIDVTVDTMGRQRIVREYYDQLCTNKMDNLEEMDEFQETYNLPRVNHEEIENLNRSMTSKEI